jgi:hypothetical protein
MNNYLLALICVGTTQLEQEAIEWSVIQGWFRPVYNFDLDKEAVELQLPDLVERFKQAASENEAANPMQQVTHVNDHH